jgi:nickel-dependent lactate racemase
MSLYLSLGNEQSALTSQELRSALCDALKQLGAKHGVLAVPPDITRLHSHSGDLTRFTYEFYGDKLQAILPAVGTHKPMTPAQLTRMFGDVPHSLFRVHDWRKDVVTLGEVPSEFVYDQSEHKLNYPWPAEVNRLVIEGGFDLVLSIGQVVPHEVIGMANYNKNILVGSGGPLSIGRSHFLGAVYGMERIMGRADNPVRRVLNYAAEHFLSDVPILYLLTVVRTGEDGPPVVRGLFIGDDNECFQKASALSLKVNLQLLKKPIKKAVVYLNDDEFHSTWLGNKAIYRTRMALADGAELIILAPGVKTFGEDPRIDQLIRKYGYRGTPATLQAVKENPELADSLGATAHLIHGSSEGRFTVIYCPGGLSREEVEGVGFQYGDLAGMIARYDPAKLHDGYNTLAGEEIFYVSNPGLGLWAVKERFSSG